MKNRLEELFSGDAEQNRPELIASVSELRLRIQEGKQYKGSIGLDAADGSRINGLVTTDSHRILLAGNSIAGESCTVLFGVDTTGLKAGDRISGTITVSCNLAECRIPVDAEITDEIMTGSEGEIRTLDDFSTLCMKSYREGFRLFTGASFSGFLTGEDRAYLPLYRGLSCKPVTYQHLEEFLISTGRKKPVLFSLENQEREPYYLETSQKDTLMIRKNTWGYLRIEVEVIGDFIRADKKVITSEDFIGGSYGLEYIVNRELLHRGRNYGSIRLKSVYQDAEYRIEASAGKSAVPICLYEDRYKAAIARDMLNLQLRRMDYRSWYESGRKITAELKEADPESPVAVLYEAYLAYSADDLPRMQQLLSLFKKGSRVLESEEQETWYLYLQKLAGIRTRDTDRLLSILRRNLDQSPDHYLYLYLLLQEDPSYERMSARIMFELEQCFEKGCNSPFLYLKAWKMLDEQESLLRRITPFYLQVLRFAAVRGRLSESLYRRTAFLSGSMREFSEPVYRILADGYRKYGCVDILEAICKLVMKGQAYRKEYFIWYSLAVQKELRITRLYEYYMETIPEEQGDRIPRQIRMYFAYNNTLGDRKKALLYSNVLQNKDSDRICYMNYLSAIKSFTLKSLEKGRISEIYASLYQSVLSRPDTVELAEKLAGVLFRHRVEVKNPSIRSVVVCHGALKEEHSYPCRDGVAYVDIYSEDACLLFEDEKHRRFCSTVEYTFRPLMEVREIADRCRELGVDNTGLQLYCCGGKSPQMKVSSQTLDCFRQAEANAEFSEGYRSVLRQKLLDYYRSNPENERMLISVLSGDMRSYGAVDRVSTAVLLIESGLYEKAFELVSEFGYEKIPDGMLLRLASRMILKREFAEEEELLCLAEYVFRRGKYDEIVLTYLLEYSMGTLEYLCGLWERARGFRLETLKLEKRILKLAVLVGRMPTGAGRILENYVLNQGQETVITAFLTWVSGCWLCRDRRPDDRIFLYLEKLSGRRWKLNLLCRLALLKYYAELDSLNPEQEREAEKILALCEEQDLTFAFFRGLPAALIRPWHLEDMLFVEERFRPGTEVTIHYSLGHGGEEEQEWKSESLKEMIPGTFSRKFLLFYGEVLTCYLTYRNGEEKLKTGMRQLTVPVQDTEGFSRYKLLNRILAAKAEGNRERMETAVADYQWQDALTAHFCRIM